MKQIHIYKRLVQQHKHNRLSHAYVFHGQQGIGKYELAMTLATFLFCQKPNGDMPCGECATCKRIISGDFVDVQHIRPDGQTIKIDQIRQLKSDVNYSSLEQQKKVYIIEDAEKMSISAANSLLKFLEEPDQTVYFLLLTNDVSLMLSTVLSRAQVINCSAVPQQTIQQMYEKQGVPEQMSYVLSCVVPDVNKGDALYRQEDFLEFYKGVLLWAEQLVAHNNHSFTFIQTTLVPFLSNKEWSSIGLDIVMLYVKEMLMIDYIEQSKLVVSTKPSDVTTRHIEILVKAKQMLHANVSAQACYEWVSLQVSRK